MASSALGTQYVEFMLKGMDVVKQGFAQVKAGLAEVGNAVKDVTARVANTPVAIGAAVAGFNLLTGAARSWVQAGLAGTAQGQLMQLQFQFLSREIAGVFVPTINAVIRGLETLVGWFRSLTGDQQTAIRRFVEAAAVMAVVNTVLGRVTAAVVGFVASIVGGAAAAAGAILTTLIPAIGSLVTAIVTGSGIATAALGLASAGLTTILGIAAAAASALVSLGLAGTTLGAGLAVGTAAGRSALRDLWQAVQPIGQALAGVADQFRRALGPVLNQLGGSFGDVLRRLAGVLTDLLGSAGPLFDRLAGYAQRFGEALAGTLDGLDLEPLRELGNTFLRVADLAVAVFERVRPALAAVVNGVRDMVGTIGAAMLGNMRPALAVWARFGEVIVTSFVNAAPVIRQVLGIIGDLVGAVYDFSRMIWTSIGPVAMDVFNAFERWQTALAPAADVIFRVIRAVVQLGVTIGRVLLGGILGQLAIGFEQTFGRAGEGIAGITAKLKEVADWLRINLPAAVETFVHTLGGAIASLIPLMQRFQLAIFGIAQAMVEMGIISQRTANNIDRSMTNATDTMRGIRDALLGFRINLSTEQAGTEQGAHRRKRQAEGNERTDVRPQGGQFETAIDLWRRLQEAAIKQDIPQRQLEQLTAIAGFAGVIAAGIARQDLERAPVSLPGDPPRRGVALPA